MKRPFVAAFLVITLAIVNECYSQIEYGQIYTDPAINIHESLMNSTFRISGENSSGQNIEGTCFILKSADSASSKGVFLITAKHVLEDIDDEYALIHYPYQEESKINNEQLSIKIRTNNLPNWIEHEDSVIDIAVLQIETNKFDSKYLLSTEFLATEQLLQEFQIKPGDNLFTIGFPLGASSNEYGFPILKGGYVASYPILPTSRHKYFLFDCEVFPASSGSPVYAREAGRQYSDGGFHANCVQLICGIIVSKTFAQNILSDRGNEDIQELISLQLAKVIPSTHLLELIRKL
jgi:hypothetical protein